MKRTPIVVGNWKLNNTVRAGLELVTPLKNKLASLRRIEVGVAPVFPSLAAIAGRLEGASIHLVAQNCHWESSGAWTGEVSATLLADVGVSHVLCGHSERRQHFGDTDERVARKIRAVLDAGLTPIVCLGETESEREQGATFERTAHQLEQALAPVAADELAGVILAYEPIWAIGTGKTASPAQAEEVHLHLREWLRRRHGVIADQVRIQYGGSVKPQNADELMSQPNIDGALVGGASLDADSFIAICRAADRSLDH